MDRTRRRVPPPTWTLDDLRSEIVEALRTGSAGDGRDVEGRALAVKASPIRGNASRIVVGTAALPAGYSTKPHSHEADEVAVTLSGSGSVDVDGVRVRLERGTVVLIPSEAVHVTHCDPGGAPLVVLWFYAPPGSEARWVRPPTEG